ncbi:MAG: sugar ABC transporter permease [Treponema sp.]|nr:sugar ABC transporter permease [Treponema sp.]
MTKTKAHEMRAAYLFLIPAFAGLTVLTYGPLVAVFALSFFNTGGLVFRPVFSGFLNYIRLFTEDPYFIDSVKVTAYFSLISVAGCMVYSLAVAMLLNRNVAARGFFRALFYLPYVLPSVAVFVGWSWLYDTNYGFFNYLLTFIGVEKIGFISNSRMVVPSLAIIAVWQSGNLIVIFLAGLQNVPRVYHEAAEIDGANFWLRFRHITIPCMTPIIFYNLLMALVTNLQVVTPAMVLTQGGPGNSSRFLTYIMYQYGFIQSHLGYASAISFIFFILVAILTGILFSTSKEWVFYEGG